MKHTPTTGHFTGLASLALFCALGTPAAAVAESVALVSSEKDNTITVISLKDQKVEGTIATCKRPRHMQITPDRKQLMVACSGDNAADVIDQIGRAHV